MTTNYVPIQSILLELSLIIDNSQWNEYAVKNWILKALRKTNTNAVLQQHQCIIPIEQHKGELPKDYKYINQIFYINPAKINLSANVQEDIKRCLNSNKIPSTLITAIKKKNALEPMMLSIDNAFGYDNATCCTYDYKINTDSVIDTTLKNGYVLISYLRYPKSDTGEILMPDNEDLKEALYHYCMYKLLESKIGLVGSTDYNKMRFLREERKEHLMMFQTLKQKAVGDLNMPDEQQYENIMRNQSRLIPIENMGDSAFSRYGKHITTKV